MTDRLQELLASRTPQLVKSGEPEDDPAKPDGYQAVRRVRSYAFNDVLFRRYTGAVQAFPWAYLRSWLLDETGTRLTLIWPETEVSLSGQHLDSIEESLQRRIIAEFRQVAPGNREELASETAVIERMEFQPIGGMLPADE